MVEGFQRPDGRDALGRPRRDAQRRLGQRFQRTPRARGRLATDFDTYVPFSTTTTIAPYPYGPVPVAVADICKWTWMYAGAPQGPNIHGKAAGYREIAAVFKKALG